MPKLVPDQLWFTIQPHLPPHLPGKKGGRPRIDDRAALSGILYVLRHAIPWRELPLELGFGSGVTCWRRLIEWQRSGVWDRIWRSMLNDLNSQERIRWQRVAIDGSSIPSPKGGFRPDLTQRTAENAGPNTTSWSINKGYRSRLRSRRRTLMIPR